ncbi:hypothetical protein B4124_3728 [Bacillus licheniformis]|nr:hypothetical protein B4124_3728 [Bacillus licheniformis]TWK54876.1 hypothetical protein CHCC20344_2237 [Bacillus licheniformis]
MICKGFSLRKRFQLPIIMKCKKGVFLFDFALRKGGVL